MVRAWSLLTLEAGDRQYVANEGYPDVLDSHYAFDSTVPNHGAVSSGDLAVLRDGDVVLGLGWIDSVASTADKKRRRRCPRCTRTGFKHRKTLVPAYLCPHCSATFDDPVEEVLDVQVYVAQYARTFRPVDGVVTVADLQPAYRAKAVQHAIRELDMDAVRAILAGPLASADAYWDADAGVRPSLPGGHGLRVGKHRVGQQRFREVLLRRFGEVCASTGPQPPASLEAAHLYRYSETPEHKADAGLLLRRDLHTLFDRWLVTVDPSTWLLRVAPQLAGFPDLAALEGKQLHVPVHLRPKAHHLGVHFALASDSWAVGVPFSIPVRTVTRPPIATTSERPLGR